MVDRSSRGLSAGGTDADVMPLALHYRVLGTKETSVFRSALPPRGEPTLQQVCTPVEAPRSLLYVVNVRPAGRVPGWAGPTVRDLRGVRAVWQDDRSWGRRRHRRARGTGSVRRSPGIRFSSYRCCPRGCVD